MATHARTARPPPARAAPRRRRSRPRCSPPSTATATPTAATAGASSPTCARPRASPAGRYHAFEVFADIAPATTPRAVELCDWLASVTLPDGGLPFALPVPTRPAARPSGRRPTRRSPRSRSPRSSRPPPSGSPRHDPAVAAHPWLARATDYCLAAIDALDDGAVRDRAGRRRSSSWTRCTTTAARGRRAARAAGRLHPARRAASPSTGGAEDETMRAARLRALPRSARRGELFARR